MSIQERRVSLKSKLDDKRTLSEKVADFLTQVFGSTLFLVLNLLWFIFWITINLSLFPFFQPFDPFPFGLLTMIVSLEAIVLSIIVLISQNRQSRIFDLRDELDLSIDTITEKELTKLLNLQLITLKKLGVRSLRHDRVLQKMVKPLNRNKLERGFSRQIHLEEK